MTPDLEATVFPSFKIFKDHWDPLRPESELQTTWQAKYNGLIWTDLEYHKHSLTQSDSLTVWPECHQRSRLCPPTPAFVMRKESAWFTRGQPDKGNAVRVRSKEATESSMCGLKEVFQLHFSDLQWYRWRALMESLTQSSDVFSYPVIDSAQT